MDTAVEPPHPRIKFSLSGSDWVEWLIVGLLCVVAAAGVAVLTGSIVATVVVACVVLVATSAVVALL